MDPVRVKELKINHRNTTEDGYGATVTIDGVHPPNFPLPRFERRITIRAWAGSPLLVDVEYTDGSVVYQPEIFDFQLGNLHILNRTDRFPCQVTIGGLEPKVRSVRLAFQEGEAVWVEMTFMPVWDDSVVDTTHQRTKEWRTRAPAINSPGPEKETK